MPVRINGEMQEISFTEGEARFSLAKAANLIQVSANIESHTLARLYKLDAEAERGVTEVPMWLSILPPLLAIVLALLFREVLLACLPASG